MRNRFKALFFAASTGAAGLIVAGTASAQEPIQLKLATTAPPVSPVYLGAFKPWGDRIAKDGEGAFTVQFFPASAIANSTNIYDRLVNGVLEVAYNIHGPLAGKFPKTSVAELPFLAHEAERSSVALWNLHENGTLAQEYAEVKPLALFIYPQFDIHVSKPIRAMEDLKGLKLSAGSRVLGEIVEALGATPISLSPPELYQAASRHTINGVTMAWTGVLQFKIAEVTSYHLETQLGSSTGFVLMNKDVYARLPQKGKDAIDRNSGRILSQNFGKALDKVAADQRAEVSKMPDHQVASLPAAEQARWEAAMRPIYQSWIARTPDGEKVLASFRAELKKEGALKD
jgi:TRAP-type C4-dicarboxylate transport system substrate-binding protein